MISEQDVLAGVWRPVAEPEWSRVNVNKRRERAKKELVIWPCHVPIGGPGSALAHLLHDLEAVELVVR